VYIWPKNACNTGYSKILIGKNVVFLERYGNWSMLQNISDLGIQEKYAEDLYMSYIFPVFSHLSEDERYTHLKHQGLSLRHKQFYLS